MKREMKIIKLLSERKSFLSIHELAEYFHVSERTIRSDLEFVEEQLKAYGLMLQRERKKGVAIFVDEIKMLQLEQDYSKGEFYSREQRQRIIIKELLKGPTTVNSLIDKTNCSRTSVQKDLNYCETLIQKQGGRLHRKAHYGIYLETNEMSYRGILLQYILQYTESDAILQVNGDSTISVKVMDELVNQYLGSQNLLFIQDYLNKYENDFMINFTDESRTYLILYLCISITRIRYGKLLLQKDVSNLLVNDDIMQWINQNQSILYSGAKMTFSIEEAVALSSQIASQKMVYLEEIDDSDATKYADRFIKAAQASLSIPLVMNEKLKSNLVLHIKSAIYRLKNDISISNPIKGDIQTLYPYAVAAARSGAKLVSKDFGKQFDEDEISFFALYIATVLEEHDMQSNIHFINAIIVCPNGYATSNILYSKIQKYFPQILIRSILSIRIFNDYDLTAIDLIITTTRLYKGVECDVIQVNPLLLESDFEKIQKYLSKTTVRSLFSNQMLNEIISIILQTCRVNDYNKLYCGLYEYFEQHGSKRHNLSLQEMIRTENILLDYPAKDWRDAVRTAGDLLYQNGSVMRKYSDKMIEKAVELGPYIVILPGVALPHAGFEDGVLRSDISFVTLRHPVRFGRKDYDPVRLVIGLAVSEKIDHIDALNMLIELLQKKGMYEALIQCQNKDEFVRCLNCDK